MVREFEFSRGFLIKGAFDLCMIETLILVWFRLLRRWIECLELLKVRLLGQFGLRGIGIGKCHFIYGFVR